MNNVKRDDTSGLSAATLGRRFSYASEDDKVACIIQRLDYVALVLRGDIEGAAAQERAYQQVVDIYAILKS